MLFSIEEKFPLIFFYSDNDGVYRFAMSFSFGVSSHLIGAASTKVNGRKHARHRCLALNHWQTLLGDFDFSSTILGMFDAANGEIVEARGVFLHQHGRKQSREIIIIIIRRQSSQLTCCSSRMFGPVPSSRSLSVSLAVARIKERKRRDHWWKSVVCSLAVSRLSTMIISTWHWHLETAFSQSGCCEGSASFASTSSLPWIDGKRDCWKNGCCVDFSGPNDRRRMRFLSMNWTDGRRFRRHRAFSRSETASSSAAVTAASLFSFADIRSRKSEERSSSSNNLAGETKTTIAKLGKYAPQSNEENEGNVDEDDERRC